MARAIQDKLHLGPGRSAIDRSLPFDILSPKSTSAARSNTLSSRFGLGAFPPHTECAHWPVPPRFLVLCCLADGGRADTSIIDLVSVLGDLQTEAALVPLLCNRGRRSFHVTFYDSATGHWRYDTSCLAPMTSEGVELAEEVALRLTRGRARPVNWVPGQVALIDNRREAHGRDDAQLTSGRRLLRMVIE